MISENLRQIRTNITAAAERAGRNPEEIKLIAVSKRFPPSAIIEAFAADQKYFGENYIQELQAKKDSVPPNALFHFIGHLQTNKAKFAAEMCSMVETVDRFKLGQALNKHLKAINRHLDILVQVNIANDPNKSGTEESGAEELLSQLNTLPNLRVCGLMTMPPYSPDPEESRPYFKQLRIFAAKMHQKGMFPRIARPEISMGMSGDYQIAIEEGATIIRVGTAIFGERTV